MSVTRTLVFDSLSLEDGLHIPSCPACGKPFKTTLEFNAAKASLKGKTKDFNRLVTFPCPSYGHKIELYLALHKIDNKNISICVQRSDAEGAEGIPDSWHLTEALP